MNSKANEATFTTGTAAFLRAFLVGISNPKGLLFFAAFLPQFIQPTEPAAPQYALLAVVSASVDCIMMFIYALGGRFAMQRFSASMMQWINRSCAGTLVLLAVSLSMYRHQQSQ